MNNTNWIDFYKLEPPKDTWIHIGKINNSKVTLVKYKQCFSSVAEFEDFDGKIHYYIKEHVLWKMK